MITPSFSPTATERVLPKLALDFTTASLDPRITFTRATSSTNPATYVNSSGNITSATNNQPRFDYDPVTLVCKGLLIEESRSNLLTYSSDFTNSNWNKNNATITGNYALAPDGTMTAARFVTIGTLGALQQFAGTDNTTQYQSIYIKSNTASDQIVNFWTGTSTVAFTATNTWKRISTPSIFASFSRLDLYAVNAGLDILVWGAQLEAGAFPTSYIPTTTTALTRNADVATMTGTNFSDWYNATNGASDIWLIPKSTSTLAYMSFDDNTANNKIVIANNTTSGQSTITSGGVLQATLTAGTITANATNKVGCSWNTNNCAATANATTPATTASATIPTVTQLRIGNNGTVYANAWIQKLFYWSQRITNNEIQAFTK